MSIQQIKIKGIGQYDPATGDFILDYESVQQVWAMKFNGVDQKMEMPIVGGVFNDNVNSLSARFTILSFPASGSGFLLGVWGNGSSKRKFKLELIDASTLKVQTRDFGDTATIAKTITLATPLELNREYHIAFVIDNGTATVYIDKVNVGQATGLHSTMMNTGTNATLGGERDGPLNPANVIVRDYRVYTGKALTAQEVTTDFDGGNVSGLTHHYPINEGIGIPADVMTNPPTAALNCNGEWVQINA